MLQQELQNALRQIDELKARNRELEAVTFGGNCEERCCAYKANGYKV
jgi:hypothetical protein